MMNESRNQAFWREFIDKKKCNAYWKVELTVKECAEGL